MRQVLLLVLTTLNFLGTSCTGGPDAHITGDNGTIKIVPGSTLTVDLTDVIALNTDGFTLSLRSVEPDYSSSTILYDLTSLYTSVGSPSSFNFVMPKAVPTARPILLVADIPSLNTQLIEVVYDADKTAKPGIASTLTYNLLKYYPGKTLANYTGVDFHAIQDLVQVKMNQLIQDSDYLSLSTTRYSKLIRYFTNGLAFNPAFLTAIRDHGVNYTFDLTTPTGILAADTPENSLTNYQYATNFKIGGTPAIVNPFNQVNNPPILMPGASQPNPGTNIYTQEGHGVTVTTQAFDLDDDYMDKNIIITYVPRVLPISLTSVPGFPFVPEAQAEYTTIVRQSNSSGIDSYTSSIVGYNEALDLNVYPATLPFDAALYPSATTTDTAYRNVYYMISDGMLRVPYHWNFKYSDVNRPPQIVKDASGHINDSSLDSVIANGETEIAPGTGWLRHGSHCEADPNATYQSTDPVTHLATYIYYQVIKSKADSPWSCAFKMTDPDIDDDPNAAADNFYYSVNMSDDYTTVHFGPSFAKIWPVYVGPPYVADRFLGSTVANCVTADGKTHAKCGQGLYQVTIDNSVKAAAESKTNLNYSYDVVIYDRPATLGGYTATATLNRTIQIPPQPGFLVNYSTVVPPGGTAPLQTLTDNGSGGKIYARQDTYLSELLDIADPTHSLSYQLSGIGIGNSNLTSPLAGTANRASFLAGTAQAMSSSFTEPFSITGGSVTWDNTNPTDPVAVNATPGSIGLLGHDMTQASASTYKNPHEYDSTCGLTVNNSNSAQGWSQTNSLTSVASTIEGWTFEVDAIDYDNVALNVGEASDPVHVTLSHDVYTALNAAGFQYCSYPIPNFSPAYYQTYTAVGILPAVNPDLCTWVNTAPADMQPIPVYYTVSQTGVTSVRKWVYHRLRFKWQPKDQGLTNGKTIADPAGFLKNMIKSGMQTSGQRYVNFSDPLDQNTVTSPQSLFASRKDMIPCLSGLTGSNGTPDVLHQLNTTTPTNIYFKIQDENKVLSSFPSYNGALHGRFEAELKLLGSRTITDPEFLKFVIYSKNCSYEDTVTPINPNPTPPPVIKRDEPLIWYSQAADASTIPRVRFQTTTDPLTTPGYQGCMNFSMTQSKDVNGNSFNEVILIQNLSASPFVLSNATLSGCTARSQLNVNPDQKYIAIASICGGSHAPNQSLWSDSNSAAIAKFILDPTTAANGGYAVGTTMSLDMFPSMYQADLNTIFPAAYSAVNSLFFDALPFDTFKLNAGRNVSIYTGYSDGLGNANWLSTNATNSIPSGSPVPYASPGYAYGIQVVDWDNQPNFMTLATPTPDPSTSNIFFRTAPGDSTRIQVYVKNNASVTFPLRTSDSPGTTTELDAFDIMQYNLVAPAVTPAATPYFSGIGRPNCLSAPGGYPSTLSTLNIASLKNYKLCNFNWTPVAADQGKKFSYTYEVQDNYSASWSGGPSASFGAGARHPAGSSSIIVNDSMAKTNGPVVTYNIDIESIEANVAPFFTNSGGATITAPYNPAGGASGWTSVFPSSTPAGIQPACASTQSPPAYDQTRTSFTCDLAVSSGDTLQSNIVITLVEGSQQTFTVYAKDSNTTAALKTLTASKPTKVFILDGPHVGRTYAVPSFASMTLNTSQDISSGTASLSFSWTPTDSEANFLSNPGGFLIPVTVTDQAYYPGTDSSFPSQFVVPALSNTVWIWANLAVKNSQPSVYYLSGTAEVPLSGVTLTLQTGQTTSYIIRVKDTDVARYLQSGSTTDFSPSYAGPAFTSVQPAGAPYYSAPYLIQEFTMSGTPASTDIGTYSSPTVGIVDPGDPSLGLAVNPDASSPPRARVFTNTNAFNTGFNIQVIGKPIFQIPSATNYQVRAYSSKQLYYPLSMFVSRPTEKLKPMFMGLDATTPVTPVRKTAGGTGLYVNENYVLRWPDSSGLDITGSARSLNVYGVLASYCNPALGSPAITLIRYNESTSSLETCKLANADVTTNTSSGAVSITLVDNTNLVTAPPTITQTEVDRNFAPGPTPSNFSLAVNQQFSDFLGRCTNCFGSPTFQNAGPITQNPSSTAYQLNASPGLDGSAEYIYSSYDTRFEFKNASGFQVNKVYKDLSPSTARKLVLSASKNETLKFKITTPASTTNYQYRWYVNGCGVASGLVVGGTIEYDLKIGTLMSGVNNDCTGEYSFSETGASALGKLVIRLGLNNGTEAVSSTTDASNTYYLWNVSVLNSDPNVITDSVYPPSNPVVLDPTYMSGNTNIQFASTISYLGKNYFAYTDLSTLNGLSVKLNELNSNGDFLSGGSSLQLTCDPSFNTQPLWIGYQTQTNNNLGIAVSNNNSYPTSTSAGFAYGQSSSTCFTNALSTSAPTASFINYGSSTVPAGYLAFSKNAMAVRTIASFTTSSNPYQSPTYDSNYFLIDGANASDLFWSYNLSSIYGSTPPAFGASFTNNVVRKNIVSGNNLFQLIGAPSNNTTGWRGFIISSTLSQKTSPNNQLTASINQTVMFSDGTGPAPAPVASDCNFNGTPLDGVYVQATNTLFVFASANDASGKGHLVAISNPTTSPSCTVVGNLLNPSLAIADHNPNISKMTFDSTNGLIYGVINQGANQTSEFYVYDIYNQSLSIRDLSATLSSYEVIFSPAINATYLFDNRKATNPVVYTPTLYKIW